LTEKIVRHALEPTFERLGSDARPEEVLDHKICDPAMGSGAFLVEACRALAARLVQAWARWPETRPKLPADEDDDLHARRLVAQRCLYGVDKNPMATDLAKLSLWLATLARDHEFTFLDHALKSGDSLVGLTRAQIAAVHWDSNKPGLPLFRDLIRERFEAALTGRTEIREAPDDVERAIQEVRYQHIERRLSDARLLGDAIIASFFSADRPRTREAKRQDIESWFNEPPASMWMKVGGLAGTLRQGERPITPFHWEIEYPEVFARAKPGFDAIVGNPPFLGGKRISSEFGHGYSDWLPVRHPESGQNIDLVAHFFRTAFDLLRKGGTFGLVATNTISQGDTRQGGLAWILRSGGSILRATQRVSWPGDAAVVISIVHVRRGPSLTPILNNRPVARISAYLMTGQYDSSPAALRANAGRCYIGAVVLGMGFTFDDYAASRGVSCSIADMGLLTKHNPAAQTRIFPFIGGEEVNNEPRFLHHRFVIDLGDFSEREARERWPELMQIVEARVKPQRSLVKRDAYRLNWWRFAERQTSLYSKISELRSVLAINCGATPHMAFARLPTGMIYAHTLAIAAFDNLAPFANLQSRPHEVWTRFFASSMKDDLRYTPSDCFETFPFPEDFETDSRLEKAGREYHDHRSSVMVSRSEGMTQTYNRFHDRRETAGDIVRLRQLHAAMDRTVLRAYSWDDLEERAEPQFLDEKNEDDHKYQGRLFWRAEFRDEVLARLLALNAERAAAERVVGSAPRPLGKAARPGGIQSNLKSDVINGGG
jgi:hypothetical protein